MELREDHTSEKISNSLSQPKQDSTKLTSYDFGKQEFFGNLPPKNKQSYGSSSAFTSNEKNEPDFSEKRNSRGFGEKSYKNSFTKMSEVDENYEDVVERLKAADLLYKEYFLEEVIYQLAKVMFSQSLTKGSKEAEKALQTLTTFLQKEVKSGGISQNLEKKILGNFCCS